MNITVFLTLTKSVSSSASRRGAQRHVAEDEDLIDVGRIRIGARLIADCTSQPLAHQVEGLRSFRLSDVGDDVGLEQFTDLVGAVGVEVLDPLQQRRPDRSLIGAFFGAGWGGEGAGERH